MDAADEEILPAAHSNEYYLELLADLERLTAPKVPTRFTLPEESIWNKLKLTSLVKKNAATLKRGTTFSLERDIQRINASTTIPTPAVSKRSRAQHIPTSNVALTDRERYIVISL